MLFFFQAEDGIRDVAVTGVQTCALPISTRPALAPTPGYALSFGPDVMNVGAVQVVPLVEVMSFTWLFVVPENEDAPAAQPGFNWSSAQAIARAPVVGSMASEGKLLRRNCSKLSRARPCATFSG